MYTFNKTIAVSSIRSPTLQRQVTCWPRWKSAFLISRWPPMLSLGSRLQSSVKIADYLLSGLYMNTDRFLSLSEATKPR